jgi:hypothetical protein
MRSAALWPRMNRPVVHDPEDASRGLAGLLAHDFSNQAIDRRDAILGLATAEALGAVDIPGSQADSGTAARGLVFHSRGTVRRRRHSRFRRPSRLFSPMQSSSSGSGASPRCTSKLHSRADSRGSSLLGLQIGYGPISQPNLQIYRRPHVFDRVNHTDTSVKPCGSVPRNTLSSASAFLYWRQEGSCERLR